MTSTVCQTSTGIHVPSDADADELRLGMIGMSEGNGHPYSWSAIINGYDADLMADCPFPVIPQYLARQRWPEARLSGARVTHLWTQDSHVSAHVAAAALIPHVVEVPEDLLGAVDAVILARDDDTHVELASPFLKAGVPLLIDKPFAISQAQARHLWQLQGDRQLIFTCSAGRFAEELVGPIPSTLGEVRHIHAATSKDWLRYAPHVIDPVLVLAEAAAAGPLRTVERHLAERRAVVTAEWESGLTATLTHTGAPTTPIHLTLVGTHDVENRRWTDVFTAFRTMLAAFVDWVGGERDAAPPEQILFDSMRILDLEAA